VHAIDDDNASGCTWSNASSTDTFSTSNTPITAPGNLNPVGVACGITPQLTWNGTSDCNVSYRVQVTRLLSGQVVVNTLTPNTFYNITPGTINFGESYTWSVEAVNGCGTGPSATATFVVYDVPLPPANLIPDVANIACDYSGPHGIPLLWDSSTYATGYDLRVDANTPSWNGNCFSPNPRDHCQNDYPATTYTVNDAFAGTSYQWWVHAINACGSSAPSIATFDFPVCSVDGTVYEDPLDQAALSGGMCDLAGASPIQPGASSYVQMSDGLGNTYTSPINPVTGAFSVAAPAGNYTIRLYPENPPWACTCPENPGDADNCGGYSVTNPDTGIQFYATQVQEEWWQTAGGDIHSQANISSTIPATCDATCSPVCSPNFSVASADANEGVVSYAGASAGFGAGSVSSAGWLANAAYDGPTYNYEFWRERVNEPVWTAPDCSSAYLGIRPSSLSIIAGGLTTFEFNCSADASLTGNWTNVNGLYTYFINFSDTSYSLIVSPGIGLDRVTVGNNGALTFVTNGNINVGDGGDPVTNQRVVQGLYLADGIFSTCETAGCGYDTATGDFYPLNFEGTVVAWGGVSLDRDIFTQNACSPSETFTYRPDMIERLPDYFDISRFTWGEVAP
jgi:hypothetical protein